MKGLYISDIVARGANVDVFLFCWLRARRKSGGILFLDVVDSTGMIQCVIERDKVVNDLFELALRIPLESAVEVTGTVVSHTNKPREIIVKLLQVIGEAIFPISPLPRSDFDIFNVSLADHLLAKRHLYLRNPRVMAVLKFRSMLTSCVRHWFEKEHFMRPQP